MKPAAPRAAPVLAPAQGGKRGQLSFLWSFPGNLKGQDVCPLCLSPSHPKAGNANSTGGFDKLDFFGS